MIPCRRCLLKDLTQEEAFQNIYSYIASIDPEIRTCEEVYQKRLRLCQTCDRLVNGLCSLCGCFVEVRAAVVRNRCADTPQKW